MTVLSANPHDITALGAESSTVAGGPEFALFGDRVL
jgi:hypothetical protein